MTAVYSVLRFVGAYEYAGMRFDVVVLCMRNTPCDVEGTNGRAGAREVRQRALEPDAGRGAKHGLPP